jgi:cellulose synthase/poly-beta-1,6-N-acetylglucosamine synthase-like glycosyltransferase
MALLILLLGLPAALLLVLAALLLFEVLSGRGFEPKAPADDGPRPWAAVLIPAHNEAAGIAATVQAVRAQLQPGDRVLVVADNCSDTTAAVARAAGAEVSERFDTEQRGKGYALDHGVRQLAADPPQVLLILDADCRLHDGALDTLVRAVGRHGRPAQALYLMDTPPADAGLRMRFGTFAWRVKNRLRPAGYARWGGPCHLMGTGMAFPWPVIEAAPLATGHLAEDMELGIQLALRGQAARFEPGALVTSRFPDTEGSARQQRTRWEHGHLSVLLQHGPRLLAQGLGAGRPEAVALALDLMIPPLALLALAIGALVVVGAGVWALLGSAVPFGLAVLAGAALVAAVAIAWSAVGRDCLRPGELLRAPLYLLWKLPLYAAFVFRRQRGWVRAKRDGEGDVR